MSDLRPGQTRLPRLSGSALESVFDRYRAGEKAKDIAESIGEPYKFISVLLSRNGVRRDKAPIITEPRKAELIAAYAAGEDTSALAIRFNVPRMYIARWARKAGIRRYYRNSIETLEMAVAAYASGNRSGVIAADLGMTTGAVRAAARKAGVNDGRTSRRVAVNDHAFDALTPEARYWIGFLIADGSIGGWKGSVVKLGLSTKDISHVEKFKAFCGSDHAIVHTPPRAYKNTGPMVTVAVYSPKICSVLRDHGIVPNKTKIAKASETMAHDTDFWRGVIDGDGGLGIYQNGGVKQAKLYICGTAEIVTQFVAFARSIAPESGANPRPNSYGLWQTQINGRAAIKVIRELYTDPCEVLERKAAAAAEILRRFG